MQKNINYIKQTLTPLYGKNEADAFVRWIMETLTGYSSTQMLLNSSQILPDEIFIEVQKIVERLKRFEPIQYILMRSEFFGLNLHVEPGVLIPRPETEELVAMIVESNRHISPAILDIGTGSGCIALSLKKAIPEAIVSACDVSDIALGIAGKNAKSNELDVKLFKYNILTEEYFESNCCYDLIVSNPPYVLQSEKELMHANVLEYEPHLALFVDDDDPLLFYRAIARFAQKRLKSGGELWFEINEQKGEELMEMLSGASFCNVQIFKDIYGKHRFVKALKL
jgi:release factor glutamine methyltransferase